MPIPSQHLFSARPPRGQGLILYARLAAGYLPALPRRPGALPGPGHLAPALNGLSIDTTRVNPFDPAIPPPLVTRGTGALTRRKELNVLSGPTIPFVGYLTRAGVLSMVIRLDDSRL